MKRILLWVLAICVLASSGCGGRATRALDGAQPAQPVEKQDEVSPERNVLTAVMPSLAGLGAGSEFEFTLLAQLAEETMQASGRILYDSAIVVPVAVEKRGLIPSSFVFFSKLDAPGVVPFAFTSLPGGRGIFPGQGELLRVRFRLIANPPPGFRVRLFNDAAYLQLRSAASGRMSFDLESEVRQ